MPNESKKAPKTVAAALAVAAQEDDVDDGVMNVVDGWHDIVKSGNLKKIEQRLKSIDVDVQSGFLAPTALHVAVATGRADVCELLLDRRANIDARHLGRGGVTALHLAAFYDSVDIVRLLLKRDANVLALSHAGLVPLDVADADAECRSLLQEATDKARKTLAKKIAAADEEIAKKKKTEVVNKDDDDSDEEDDEEDDENSDNKGKVEFDDAVSRFLANKSGATTGNNESKGKEEKEKERHKSSKSKSSKSSSSSSSSKSNKSKSKSKKSSGGEASNVAADLMSSVARRIDFKLLDFPDPPVLLGKGATARVMAATFGGIDVAVKMLHCEEGESEAALEALKAELEMASLFSHPNIVQVLACAVEPPTFAIVMERMESSLYHNLHVQKRPFVELERLHVARSVASALVFVHAHNAMHRDLKSPNVLLGANGAVKVSDFGTARLMSTLTSSSMTANVGTAQWSAPEVLTNSNYDSRADVYSFGILLWEIYAQQVPFAALGLSAVQLGMQIAMKNARPTLPVPNAPEPIMDLAQRCWSSDPAARPAIGVVAQSLKDAFEAAKAAASKQQAEDAETSGGDDKECVVCFSGKRETAMQCGHVALCMPCGKKLDKCPICSQSKQTLIKLFDV
jgi:tRNA A-37 threonylcarbamoyl transferase component Bud32